MPLQKVCRKNSLVKNGARWEPATQKSIAEIRFPENVIAEQTPESFYMNLSFAEVLQSQKSCTLGLRTDIRYKMS